VEKGRKRGEKNTLAMDRPERGGGRKVQKTHEVLLGPFKK